MVTLFKYVEGGPGPRMTEVVKMTCLHRKFKYLLPSFTPSPPALQPAKRSSLPLPPSIPVFQPSSPPTPALQPSSPPGPAVLQLPAFQD